MTDNTNGDVKVQLAVGEHRFQTLEEKVSKLEGSVGDIKEDLGNINERQHDQLRKMDSIGLSVNSLSDKMDKKIFDDKDGLVSTCTKTRTKYNERFTWLRTIFVAMLMISVGVGVRGWLQDKKHAEAYKQATELLIEAKAISTVKVP